jgi:hypothetical protein
MPLLESRLDGSVVKSSGSLSRYLNQCQPMHFRLQQRQREIEIEGIEARSVRAVD